MPKFGDRKTIGGVTGEWDGQTWRKIPDGPANPTAEGFGNPEVDRLLAEARGTATRADQFDQSINPHGTQRPDDTPDNSRFYHPMPHESPASAVVGSIAHDLAQTPHRFLKGATTDLVTGALHTPSALADAWKTFTERPGEAFGEMARIPETIGRAITDPNTDPGAAAELLGNVVGGEYTPGIVARGVRDVMPALREGTAAVGRGMEALGQATRPRGGIIPTVTAATGHPFVAAAEMAIPPALRGIGRVLQKAAPGASDATDAVTGLRGAEIPAADFFTRAKAAGMSNAEIMAEMSKRGATRASGGMTPWQGGARPITEAELPTARTAPYRPDNPAQRGGAVPMGPSRLATEVPYRMGEPTGVEGLNSGILRDEPGIGVALNDASRMSKTGFQQLNDFMGSGPDQTALAGIRSAIKADRGGEFSHEQFVQNLKDSLAKGAGHANDQETVTSPEVDLTDELSSLSPLDAASRLAKLTRMQRSAGAAYAE